MKDKKISVRSEKSLAKRTKTSLMKLKHVRRILAKRKFFARLRMTMFKRYNQKRKVELLNMMKLEIIDEKLEIMNEQMEIMVGKSEIMNEKLDIMNEKLEMMDEKMEIMLEKLEIMNEKIHLLKAMWERKQQLKEEVRQLCYQKSLLTLASLVVQQFLQKNDSEEEESAQEEEENEDEEEEDDEDDDEDGDE